MRSFIDENDKMKKINGHIVKKTKITPRCREFYKDRAIVIALAEIRMEYEHLLMTPENKNATFRITLTLEQPEGKK